MAATELDIIKESIRKKIEAFYLDARDGDVDVDDRTAFIDGIIGIYLAPQHEQIVLLLREKEDFSRALEQQIAIATTRNEALARQILTSGEECDLVRKEAREQCDSIDRDAKIRIEDAEKRVQAAEVKYGKSSMQVSYLTVELDHLRDDVIVKLESAEEVSRASLEVLNKEKVKLISEKSDLELSINEETKRYKSVEASLKELGKEFRQSREDNIALRKNVAELTARLEEELKVNKAKLAEELLRAQAVIEAETVRRVEAEAETVELRRLLAEAQSTIAKVSAVANTVPAVRNKLSGII
ncbi:MAG: hypothetical protein HOL58_06620 [Francisellaceae bacterium]|nr:hypothetical protein [Francisellaceae bacterium]